MKPWTAEELAEEWRVVYLTRLGMLTDIAPTVEQMKIARAEADAQIEKLKNET